MGECIGNVYYYLLKSPVFFLSLLLLMNLSNDIPFCTGVPNNIDVLDVETLLHHLLGTQGTSLFCLPQMMKITTLS